jgi:hypothetical protein
MILARDQLGTGSESTPQRGARGFSLVISCSALPAWQPHRPGVWFVVSTINPESHRARQYRLEPHFSWHLSWPIPWQNAVAPFISASAGDAMVHMGFAFLRRTAWLAAVLFRYSSCGSGGATCTTGRTSCSFPRRMRPGRQSTRMLSRFRRMASFVACGLEFSVQRGTLSAAPMMFLPLSWAKTIIIVRPAAGGTLTDRNSRSVFGINSF